MIGSPTNFAAALLAWYDRSKRDLPWRVGTGKFPNPYHVLLSELMLQQTQVATVVPYFHRFIERFPSIAALAAAEEQEVLRLWQGLGYYSRARNLHQTAKDVLANHGGDLPKSVESLLTLRGVGRYTARAIASMAFGTRAPILDGNVIRVLCRIDFLTADPRERAMQVKLWQRAEEILPKERVGDFNSALMELGATVCIPRTPHCLICPVSKHCQAVREGNPEDIPLPKPTKATPLVKRWAFVIEQGGQVLIEQRPATGRWAGLWQFVTAEPSGRAPDMKFVHRHTGLDVSKPRRLAVIRHALTHRRYQFTAFHCECAKITKADAPRRWVTWAELDRYPMSKPQLEIASRFTTHSPLPGKP